MGRNNNDFSQGKWEQQEFNYFGSNDTQNPNYMGEVDGRPMVESDMPEGLAYKHPIRSYGKPRRISVYDMSDVTKRSSTGEKGLINDPDTGERGLVGVSDFYREPERPGLTTVDKDGKKTTSTMADVNVGYMQSALENKGIGRQMFNHMLNTTPTGSQLNVGLAASDATLHMAKKAQKENPGSVSYKVW
jgi:hypothetical protein